MRRKIVAGNWKMNLDVSTGLDLVTKIQSIFPKDNTRCTAIVCPPLTHLFPIRDLISGFPSLSLGAQNCSENLSGAYTGEISTIMLKSVGVRYVILGHSERRAYQKESNTLLALKVNQVLKTGMLPIFCCGESLSVRKAGTQNKFVNQQIEESLFHLTADEIVQCVIAYEPIWAIGTGETATSQQAQEMHASIRNLLAKKYDAFIADNISILYGGSCNPANAKEIFSRKDVDGGLIGGASLNAQDFVDIIQSF